MGGETEKKLKLLLKKVGTLVRQPACFSAIQFTNVSKNDVTM